MFKRPLLIFSLLTTALVVSSIGFLQSRMFAGLVQNFLSKSIPPELGVRGSFDEFGIRLFPPAVSISRPRLVLDPKNLFSLPADSVIRADRIDLRFRPVQMLTGKVMLDQVRIVGGDIELELSAEADRSKSAPSRKGSHGIRWDELVQVQVRGIALENTRLALAWGARELRVEIDAQDVLLSRSGDGTDSHLDLSAVIPSLVLLNGKRAESRREIVDLKAEAMIYTDRIEVQELAADVGTDDFEFLINSEGVVKGNVLNPESLQADLKVRARGELQSLLEWAGFQGSDSSGNLSFNGKMRGDFLRLAETLIFDGKIDLDHGQVFGWKVDSVEGAARFESQGSPSRGTLEVKSAQVTFADGGGKLEVGTTAFKLGQAAPVKIPLILKSARLNSLLGPYHEVIENLDTTWTGKLDGEFQNL